MRCSKAIFITAEKFKNTRNNNTPPFKSVLGNSLFDWQGRCREALMSEDAAGCESASQVKITYERRSVM